MSRSVAVGDLGKASTPLRPAGRVVIRGTMHSVRAEAGYIEEGCAVIVVRSDQFGLIVRSAEDTPKHHLPDVGAVVPSQEQTTLLREEREEQVRREADRHDKMQSRKEAVGCALVLGIPAGLLGYWIAGPNGAAVAGIGMIGLILVIRVATEFLA